MWYSSFWSEGPKNHQNLKILVSKFVPRGFEARRTWGFEAQHHGVSRGSNMGFRGAATSGMGPQGRAEGRRSEIVVLYICHHTSWIVTNVEEFTVAPKPWYKFQRCPKLKILGSSLPISRWQWFHRRPLGKELIIKMTIRRFSINSTPGTGLGWFAIVCFLSSYNLNRLVHRIEYSTIKSFFLSEHPVPFVEI